MKSIFLLTLTVCTFTYNNSYAQVNLQTGESVYSIPIFEHIDPKSGLSSSVSLDYKSNGGIKVAEYASIAGQSWNLNAGGSIVRIQHGEPDDQFQTESFTIGTGDQIFETNNSYAFNYYYPNGYLYSPFPLAEIPKEKALIPRFRQGTETSNKYKNSPRALDDKEQDVFYFNYGNISGAFVIGKNGQVEVLDNSKIKVIPSYFTINEMLAGSSAILRTKIKSFTIVDCNGIEYVFSELEWSNTINVEEVSINTSGNIPLTVSKTTTPSIPGHVITKWFLTKIQNPLTGDVITFRYTTKYINYLGAILPSYSLIEGPNTSTESVSVFESWVSGATKILEQIDFPDDFHVQLNYGIRTDMYSTIPRLTDIQVLHSDRNIHSAVLSHAYFFKNLQPGFYTTTEQEKYNTRLCLTGVTVDELKYDFSYFTGEEGDERNIVPPVHSLSQDNWGYYNGSEWYSSEILNYNADNIKKYLNDLAPFPVKKDFARNGLLKSITLPTSGTISFEYEQNRVVKNQEEVEIGGVRVVKVTKSDPVGQNPDVVTQYSYDRGDGKSSGWGGEGYIGDWGNALYIAHDDGFNWGGISGQGLVAQQPALMNLPKAIFDIASVFGVVSASNPLAALYLEVIKRVVFILVNILDPNTTYSSIVYSYSPFFHGAPISLSYSRVEEKIVSGGIANGKVVHEYTSGVVVSNTWPFSSKQRLDNWKYNLPIHEIAYNSDDKIIKQTDYSYTEKSTVLDDNFKSCKVESQNKYSSRYDWPLHNLDQIDESWFTQEFYHAKKGNSLLKQKATIDFGTNPTDLSFNLEENYNYEGSKNNLPREIYSFNSKGDKIGQTIYYSADYTINGGAMQEMRDRNILNVPITILKWYIPSGATNRFYTDILTTEYTITASGTIKPLANYTAFNNEPIPQTSVGLFEPSTIFISYPNTRQVISNTYDANGNLVLTEGDGKRRVGYVYDHDGRYVTATVSNAGQNDFAFSGFETENGGNWVITNCEYAENAYYAVTGKKYLKVGSGGTIVKELLDPAVTYTVSYWSHSNPLSINGNFDQIPPLITINGWSLYSHTVQGVSSIELTRFYTSEIVDIDELRVHPKNARMSTVSYDPAYGKISDADLNNRITHFKYDASGRLEMILDQRKNVVKTFDYNTKRN